MSFFFDVLTNDGFILASDVRLFLNDKVKIFHKLAPAPYNSKVICAIAVCGDYPENSINFFFKATMTGDTLRDVAQAFAQRWTERYAGTSEYSAVHLVGFERIPESDMKFPQLWYWHNLDLKSNYFFSKEKLLLDLDSFSNQIPYNNHIPYLIRDYTGKFPGQAIDDEAKLVFAFLQLYQPFFTWNGDTSFWHSALDTVDSAIGLLKKEKTNWSIDEVARLAGFCLTYLANIGSFLKSSTVGLSSDQEADILKITPTVVEKISWVNIDGKEDI